MFKWCRILHILQNMNRCSSCSCAIQLTGVFKHGKNLILVYWFTAKLWRSSAAWTLRTMVFRRSNSTICFIYKALVWGPSHLITRPKVSWHYERFSQNSGKSYSRICFHFQVPTSHRDFPRDFDWQQTHISASVGDAAVSPAGRAESVVASEVRNFPQVPSNFEDPHPGK